MMHDATEASTAPDIVQAARLGAVLVTLLAIVLIARGLRSEQADMSDGKTPVADVYDNVVVPETPRTVMEATLEPSSLESVNLPASLVRAPFLTTAEKVSIQKSPFGGAFKPRQSFEQKG